MMSHPALPIGLTVAERAGVGAKPVTKANRIAANVRPMGRRLEIKNVAHIAWCVSGVKGAT